MTSERPARPARGQNAGAPNIAEAQRFMQEAEAKLKDLYVKSSRASWIQATYITDDTEEIAAWANNEFSTATQDLAMRAKRFDGMQMPADLQRKFLLLKLALVAPPPSNPAEAAELTRLNVALESEYGKGKYCPGAASVTPDGSQQPRSPNDDQATAPSTTPPSTVETATVTQKPGNCLQINEITKIFQESRDPKQLLDVWVGWHKVGAPMRQRYSRFVELSNKGARELGFKDTGAMWRSNYDMPPDQFANELDRLWLQVRPLYLQLHAYARSKLGEKYGTQLVSQDGMIPAHLFGNIWAQEWGNIYDVVKPKAAVPVADLDITGLLKAKNVNELGMVRFGEGFFTSIGLQKLPQTFFERSLFMKPPDRDVVCHASAWDVDTKDDVRIKMCIQRTGEDFVTIHHELGHNYYQMAYNKQPYFFQGSAHDGFHEALGDAVALSVTPGYLNKVGLLPQVPQETPDAEIDFLLRQAMDKVAFLPFGLLIDQWRWKVFSGEVAPANYNKAWWELRNKYQGVAAPVERTENDFDPGAKYHVPANTPYTRYFLARILQFQMHRALCKEAGYTGPLHKCSIYGNKQAGAKLARFMELGQSRPWPDALEQLSGERRMDATAILDYFAPLMKWLEQQNRGKKLGWGMEDAFATMTGQADECCTLDPKYTQPQTKAKNGKSEKKQQVKPEPKKQ